MLAGLEVTDRALGLQTEQPCELALRQAKTCAQAVDAERVHARRIGYATRAGQAAVPRSGSPRRGGRRRHSAAWDTVRPCCLARGRVPLTREPSRRGVARKRSGRRLPTPPAALKETRP